MYILKYEMHILYYFILWNVVQIHYHSKFWGQDFMNVFERSLFCSPGFHLFDQKYNKNGNIVKY